MSISTNSIINNEYFYPLKSVKISSEKKLDINNLLKIEAIKNSINGNKIFENKCGKSIKNISGFFCKRIKINIELFNKLSNSIFYKDYLPYLEEKFNTKSVEEVIKYLHIEYFILVDLFNLKLISHSEIKNFLNLNFDKDDFIKNSNLLITNKQSFELTEKSIDSFVSGKNKPLKNEVVVLFKELGITLIEIPQFYKLDLLVSFLEEVKELKKRLEIDNFSFKLRFKKIKHFKKDGMYIVNDKTIIVDPRKPKAFIHELGHYIFENKIDINLFNIGIQCNNKYIKNSKIETYSIESENFAYNFESLFN